MDKKIEKTVDNIIELYESELKITKIALELMGEVIICQGLDKKISVNNEKDQAYLKKTVDYFITKAKEANK